MKDNKKTHMVIQRKRQQSTVMRNREVDQIVFWIYEMNSILFENTKMCTRYPK